MLFGLHLKTHMWKIHKNVNSHFGNKSHIFAGKMTKAFDKHIHTFKGLCGNFAAIGKHVPDKEKVLYLLTSLGPEYETFITTMLKPPRPFYSELISQLQSHDQCHDRFSNMHNSSAPQVAFYGQQQRSHQVSSQHLGNYQAFTLIRWGFMLNNLITKIKTKPFWAPSKDVLRRWENVAWLLQNKSDIKMKNVNIVTRWGI